MDTHSIAPLLPVSEGELLEQLQAQIVACQSAHRPLSLLLLDVRALGLDEHGMCRYGDALQQRYRASDRLLRVGQRRWLLLLPNTPAEQLLACAKRLLDQGPAPLQQIEGLFVSGAALGRDGDTAKQLWIDIGGRLAAYPQALMDYCAMAVSAENQSLLRDPLTGMLNRSALQTALPVVHQYAQQHGGVYSLLLLDLDHFKSINDAFGHSRGDQALLTLGQLLNQEHRQADSVFRYGGDEFVLLLANTERAQAFACAQRLLSTVREHPLPGNPPLQLSLSIGVACYPEDGSSAEAVLECADQRHYRAKRAGRGRVVAHDLPGRLTGAELNAPSRLIEREHALLCVQDFLIQLSHQQHGLLLLQGSLGSGRSRLLQEVAQQGRLYGYQVLHVKATPALRQRCLGALSVASRAWEVPMPEAGDEGWLHAVSQTCQTHLGLLVLLDDPEQLDNASLELICRLFRYAKLKVCGLVVGCTPAVPAALMALGPALWSHLVLAPLSLDGLRVWLRHALHDEPASNFLQWLHDSSLGLPGVVQRTLALLIERNILRPLENRWQLGDYTNLVVNSLLEAPPLVNTNLPTDLPLLLGREAELRRLGQLLDHYPLITIQGPGGLGKTRLALQVGRELLAQFSDGCYWVNLAPLRDAEHLASTIAETLGVPTSATQTPLACLRHYVRGRNMLLILDNFEHLRSAASVLHDLLHDSQHLRLLVTSRDRLGLVEEITLVLNGLSYASEDSANYLHYPAARLFVRHARQTDPDFTPSTRQQRAILRICRLTEGMPLALELAAAWVRSYSCETIAAKIESDLSFLAQSMQAKPSLTAVLHSFWGLLDQHEQRVLCRLSVFRGGFRMGAAHKVAGASPFFLDALTHKAYLRTSQHGRYEMHELLRQFAAEQLAKLPELSVATQTQHASYYSRYLKGYFTRPERVLNELDNIRSAWEWASLQAQGGYLRRAYMPLARLYSDLGLLREGSSAFALTLAHLPVNNIGHRRLAARLRIEQAQFLILLGDYSTAVKTARCAFADLDQRKDIRWRAEAGLAWGQALWRPGHYSEGREILLHTRELAAHAKAVLIEATCLRFVGNIAGFQGEDGREQNYYAQALRLYRSIHHGSGEAATLNVLGDMLFNRGRFQQAQALLEQALSLSLSVGDYSILSPVQLNLGLLYIALGEYGRARQILHHALVLSRQHGKRQIEGEALSYLGNLLCHAAVYRRALRMQQQALRRCRALGDQQIEGHTLASIGRTLYHLERYPHAQQHLQHALELAQRLGERNLQARSLTSLGHVFLAQQQYREAQSAYRHALQIRRRLDQPHLAIEIRAGLVALYQKLHKPAAVVRYQSSVISGIYNGLWQRAEEPMLIIHHLLPCIPRQGTTLHYEVAERALRLLQQRAQRLPVQWQGDFIHHWQRCWGLSSSTALLR